MRLFCVIIAIALGGLTCSAATAATKPQFIKVTLVIHVPLQFNDKRPVPHALLEKYERQFRSLGDVVDRPGIGSFGSEPPEPDDHVFISTTLFNARLFLRSFLPELRSDLQQQSALGEIFGGPYATAESENRTKMDVVFPLTDACDPKMTKVQSVFGASSEYSDLHGIHVYSSVKRADAAGVRAKLAALGISADETQSTFELYPKEPQ
jgi:hypothetical protein